MKRNLSIILTLAMATAVAQNPPAKPAGAPAAAPAAGQAAAPAPPQGKRPPAAKTQEELSAYQAAAALAGSDIAAAEKAADDFAAKYTDSELRAPLYTMMMQYASRGGHDSQALEIGRKAIAVEPNNTLALVMTSQIIAERTQESDLDRDERYAEGMKNAETAVTTIDTGLTVPANFTPEQVAGAKSMLIGMARSSMGFIEMKKKNYAAAEDYYKKALEATASNPDPTNLLRLAVTLDKQGKYAEALTYTDKAITSADASQMPDVSQLAKNEKTRLQSLLPKK